MAVPFTFANTPVGTYLQLTQLDDNFSYLTNTPTLLGLTVANTLNVAGASIFSGSALFNNISINGTITIQGNTFNPTGVTGTGDIVLNTNPVLVTPNLGVPSFLDLSNATNLPIGSVVGIQPSLYPFLATPNSANLRSAVVDETGTGALVFAGGPTLVAPNLGTPASGNLANCTGYPAAAISGVLPIAQGGTGAATAPLALNNLLPAQAGNNRKFLSTDGAGLVTWSDAVFVVTNIAALRAITPLSNQNVNVDGYYTAGDGGGGIFYGVAGAAAGTYVDNGGTVIVPTGGNGSAAWIRIYSDAIDVKWFGAKGDGVTDDTSAISAAVNYFTSINSTSSQQQLLFPSGNNFSITGITLNNINYFSIRIDGVITNIATKAGPTATNTNNTTGGVNATFKILNCSNFSIEGQGQINTRYRQCFVVGTDPLAGSNAACSYFSISITIFGESLNDNTHANIFRYCSYFSLHGMLVNAVTKKPPYVNNATPYYYDWCNPLLFLDCNAFSLSGITSNYNSMNGIYIGSNCYNLIIENCVLEHNGGSGVQLAWSSFGSFPTNFVINGNISRFNRADGADLSNTGAFIDCYGVFSNNISYYNGWGTEDTSGTSPTNDGSGVGTFVNIGRLVVSNNTSTQCSRTIVFCVNCFNMVIDGNIGIKTLPASIGDGMYFETCTGVVSSNNNIEVMPTDNAYKLFSATGNTGVVAYGNSFYGKISYSGGNYLGCEFKNNGVVTTTAIVCPVNFIGNGIEVTGAGQNGLFVTSHHVIIDSNRVTAPNFGIVSDSYSNVIITNNTVNGGVGGIRIDANSYTRVSGNSAVSQTSPAIHFVGACNNCEMSMSRGSSVSGNSFRIESTCTMSNVWANNPISGPVLYGGTYGIFFP